MVQSKENLLVSIGRFITKPFAWFFTSSKFRWGFITFFFLAVILTSSILDSVEQKSPVPVIQTVGGFLTGADKNIHNDIDKLEANPDISFGDYLWIVLDIAGAIWFVIVWYKLAFIVINAFGDQYMPYFNKFFWATLILAVFNLSYIILSLALGWTAFDVTNTTSWLRIIPIPFIGALIRLVLNFDLLVTPLLHLIYSIPLLGDWIVHYESAKLPIQNTTI